MNRVAFEDVLSLHREYGNSRFVFVDQLDNLFFHDYCIYRHLAQVEVFERDGEIHAVGREPTSGDILILCEWVLTRPGQPSMFFLSEEHCVNLRDFFVNQMSETPGEIYKLGDFEDFDE